MNFGSPFRKWRDDLFAAGRLSPVGGRLDLSQYVVVRRALVISEQFEPVTHQHIIFGQGSQLSGCMLNRDAEALELRHAHKDNQAADLGD